MLLSHLFKIGKMGQPRDSQSPGSRTPYYMLGQGPPPISASSPGPEACRKTGHWSQRRQRLLEEPVPVDHHDSSLEHPFGLVDAQDVLGKRLAERQVLRLAVPFVRNADLPGGELEPGAGPIWEGPGQRVQP